MADLGDDLSASKLSLTKLRPKHGDVLVVSVPPEQLLGNLAFTARWFQQLVPEGVRVLVIPDTITVEQVPRERLVEILRAVPPTVPTADISVAKHEHLHLVTRDDVGRIPDDERFTIGRVSGRRRDGHQCPGMPHAICHACGIGDRCSDVDCPNDGLGPTSPAPGLSA